MPANPNFDDIVTTTLRSRTGKLADNATVTTAGLDRARRKGKVKRISGGRTIVKELEVLLNTNGGWFAGYDTLSVTPFQPLTAAEYDWKQAYVNCVWSGQEKRMNMGPEQSIRLVASRIKNSEKSLVDLVAQAYYSDGTGFSGKQLHGLNLLVPVDPSTGTVGGIDRAGAGNTFWQSQVGSVDFDAAINIAATAPSAFLSAMNSLAIVTVRGSDRPDLWLFDAIGYARYLEGLQPMQQIVNTDMAGAGFTALKYYGVGQSSDVVLDNGYCPSKTGFALNTEYIYLDIHSDLDFEPLGGERMPINQDATVRFFGMMGNLCGSNLARQGRLKDAGT